MDHEISERELNLPLCVGCGYALVGLPKDQCPECGRHFDPADARTFTTQRSLKYAKCRLVWSLSIIAPALVGIVLAIAIRGADAFCVGVGLATPYLFGALLGQNGNRYIYRLSWIVGLFGFGVAAYFIFVSSFLEFDSSSAPTDGYAKYVVCYFLAFVSCSFVAGVIIGWISRNHFSKSLRA